MFWFGSTSGAGFLGGICFRSSHRLWIEVDCTILQTSSRCPGSFVVSDGMRRKDMSSKDPTSLKRECSNHKKWYLVSSLKMGLLTQNGSRIVLLGTKAKSWDCFRGYDLRGCREKPWVFNRGKVIITILLGALWILPSWSTVFLCLGRTQTIANRTYDAPGIWFIYMKGENNNHMNVRNCRWSILRQSFGNHPVPCKQNLFVELVPSLARKKK